MIFLAGAGDVGAALTAASWLDGRYSEVDPEVSRDEAGLVQLCRRFSASDALPGHPAVATPGASHGGDELGHVLVHAFGAVFDNPDLMRSPWSAPRRRRPAAGGVVAGDFRPDPRRDGAVLPVLHLDEQNTGSLLVRKQPGEVRALLEGHGYEVFEVSVDDQRAGTSGSPPSSPAHWAVSARSSGRHGAGTLSSHARTGR